MTQQVVAPPSHAAMFITLTVRPGREAEFRDFLSDVASKARSVSFRNPDGALLCVIGLGSNLWDRLFAGPRPKHLHELEPIRGGIHTAVSTPGDVLIHLRARRMDLCFELAWILAHAYEGICDPVDEVHGFKYFDMRDLLGFVDGTENPEGDDAYAAALIGDEDPDFAGGSYVITQKYVHDMAAWHALTVEEQERVIGRTKLDDVELDDDVKPTNSHVALNTLDDPKQAILRDNMPFGNVSEGEFGTFFIGYAADPGITEEMLRRMFIGEPVGNYDRILDFSTATTGNLFFVPPHGFVDDPPPFVPGRPETEEPERIPPPEPPTEAVLASEAEPDDAPETPDSFAGRPADPSLGIGSLRPTRPSAPKE